MPNANTLEIVWFAVNLIGMLAGLAVGTVVVWRGVQALWEGANGARRMLFVLKVSIQVVLNTYSLVFTWLGWVYMNTPEPIRDVNRQSNTRLGWVAIGLAGLITGYQVLELVLRPRIDAAIAKAEQAAKQLRETEDARQWDGTTERRQDERSRG